MSERDHTPRASPDWSARLAGGLLALVGAVNALFGVLSLVSDLVELSAPVAGGLLAAGLVTAALGVLVWRGSRLATMVGLTVFGLLLVAQLPDLLAGGPASAEAADHPARGVLLAVVVAALALAAVRSPRTSSSPRARSNS